METPFHGRLVGGSSAPALIATAWRFDASGHDLQGPGGRRHLTPRETAVMACLVEAGPGQPVSREDLLNRVWADTEVGDEALSVVVSRLRRHLRRAGIGDIVIRTLPKTGYMLADAPPQEVALHALAGRTPGANVPARRMAGLAMVVSLVSLVLALAMGLAHNFSTGGLHAAPAAAVEPAPPSEPEPDPGSWRH